VFEIGNSLREARLRQGYELPRVEADTKIRAKYLKALEEEHFEVLPGETYVKGFLRTYAEYLGLDGILVVVAWKFGSSGPGTSTGPPPSALSSGDSTGTTTEQGPTAPPQSKNKKTRLVLYAEGGDCWLRIRSRSATGKLLYEGTLQAGQTQRFVDDKRIWLQLGAPAYLKATVNGKQIRNMPEGPAVAVIQADGLHVVSTA
jgi:cytoskeletal protein RodZ